MNLSPRIVDSKITMTKLYNVYILQEVFNGMVPIIIIIDDDDDRDGYGSDIINHYG